MPGTLHLVIRNAAHALLAAAPALADGGVIKGKRGRPMAAQFKRQIHVYLDTSIPERAQLTLQPDDWMTRLRIEASARADETTGLDGEENADELAKEAYARLAADPSFGGLLMDLVPLGLAWDTEEADTQIAVTQLVFDAKHRTPANSIAA